MQATTNRTQLIGKASHNGYLFQKLFSKRTIQQNRARYHFVTRLMRHMRESYLIWSVNVWMHVPNMQCTYAVGCDSGHQCAHELRP